MRIIECVQGDCSWWEARRGVPSASNFDRIITATGKPSAQAHGYICELIADFFCQAPGFFSERGLPRTTQAMQDGIDAEPEARSFYELLQGQDVRQVGFCLTDEGTAGCSPDGLVGDDGGLELKCPMAKTQIGYLLQGGLPSDYRAQVHGSLVVTGRKWWDFLSYCPGLPPLLLRVTPDEYTAKLSQALAEFLEKYRDEKAAINELIGRMQ